MAKAERSESRIDATLRNRRPVPSRQFEADLRERLIAVHWRARRPPRLWVLLAVYVCAGAVLLVLAAIGALGGGPFGS